jgi:hypothetical protein
MSRNIHVWFLHVSNRIPIVVYRCDCIKQLITEFDVSFTSFYLKGFIIIFVDKSCSYKLTHTFRSKGNVFQISSLKRKIHYIYCWLVD